MGETDTNTSTATEQESYTWKHFISLLSKPLKWLFSIFGSLTGVGIIGLGTTLTGVITTLGNENQNYELWVKLLVIFVMITLVCFFLLTILMAVGFMRVKFIEAHVTKETKDRILLYNKSFDENVEKFDESIHKLNESITQFSLAKYILDKSEISELEKNACGKQIIVMSSKFALDTGPLQKIILDNLRKGIQYVYLIPEENYKDMEMHRFRTMVNNWWNSLNKAFPKEKAKQYMCDDYKNIVRLVESGQEEQALIALKEYFCRHIKFRFIAKEYGIVTVVMYQRQNNDFQWDTIIMLPISENDEYYAFHIPDAEGKEKKDLEEKIQALSLKSECFSFTV